MNELDKLNIEEISKLTTGEAEDFKQEVKDEDFSLRDIKALKKAEESGQERDEVLDFLNDQIDTKNVSNYLDIAEDDTEKIDSLVQEIEQIEHVETLEEEKIDIDQDDLIDLVGGTVEEMREFIEKKPLTGDQLQDVLDAEKRVKDRKTAKQFLKKKLENRRMEEDASSTREDLKDVKEDIEKLKEDNKISDAGGEPENEDKEPEDEAEEDEKESEEDKEGEEPEAEPEEVEDELEEDAEKSENEEDEEEQEQEEIDEKDSEEESGESESNLERKKEIAEDLNLDMSEDELESISLEQMENIKSEKKHREHLIKRLKENGMEEEKLRNSSTADLEKIANSIDEDSESQEEHEEMREEAEEDLEMLMGAVRGESDESSEDEGKNAKEKFEDFKDSISEKFNRSSDEEETSDGINAEKVQEVLDQYRKLDDEEAAVKTAHIMKGYLEQKLNIGREMTYKELAEKMPTEEYEEVDKLADFFLKMHREQYTGRIAISNSEDVIDTCEKVIQNLK